MKPHKHAELIKLWADGYEIQIKDAMNGKWLDRDRESIPWYENSKYRVKPKFEVGDKVCVVGERRPITIVELGWEGTEYCYYTDNKSYYYESDMGLYTEPKLVPFTFDDAEMLIGRAIKAKRPYIHVTMITCVGNVGVNVGDQTKVVYYDSLLEKFTFLDGSPCGKEVR